LEDPRPGEAREFAARNDWSARFAVLMEFLGIEGAGESVATGARAR